MMMVMMSVAEGLHYFGGFIEWAETMTITAVCLSFPKCYFPFHYYLYTFELNCKKQCVWWWCRWWWHLVIEEY